DSRSQALDLGAHARLESLAGRGVDGLLDDDCHAAGDERRNRDDLRAVCRDALGAGEDRLVDDVGRDLDARDEVAGVDDGPIEGGVAGEDGPFERRPAGPAGMNPLRPHSARAMAASSARRTWTAATAARNSASAWMSEATVTPSVAWAPASAGLPEARNAFSAAVARYGVSATPVSAIRTSSSGPLPRSFRPTITAAPARE